MAMYKGTASDAARASRLAKQREEQQKLFEQSKKTIQTDAKTGLRNISDAFAAKEARYEEQFKASTIGLVTWADFKRKRQTVERMMYSEQRKKEDAAKQARKRREDERKRHLRQLSFDTDQEQDDLDATTTTTTTTTTMTTTPTTTPTPTTTTISSPDSSSDDTTVPSTANKNKNSQNNNNNGDTTAKPTSVGKVEKNVKEKEQGNDKNTEKEKEKNKEKEKEKNKEKDDDDDNEGDNDQDHSQDTIPSGEGEGEGEGEGIVKKRKLTKNPFVDTHFLPDRDREEHEQQLRKKLESEWKELQEKIKNETIEITYSYWDGSGHRRSIKVTKGTRIDQFLERCRRELCDAFHELRGISSENLLYVKEDLIIPQHYTFYDLIISKARGKSGPLFHFDVHDDVRLLSDATVEKDESHAGKIVTRGWYERNQHIFPASRWEVYDPAVKRERYTIR